ncbi:MAG TPA: hypothetical protein VLV48_01760, partial [Thermoanaerobaculia bacterium]|nr:hypothetical protein [Thermoanaerobaculia bacterium]
REGATARVIRSISVPESRQGDYPIRVVTNDSVTSAKVTVDGRALFAPHDFRPGARVLTSEPTALTRTSEVEVELAGKPGAEIVLLVMGR